MQFLVVELQPSEEKKKNAAARGPRINELHNSYWLSQCSASFQSREIQESEQLFYWRKHNNDDKCQKSWAKKKKRKKAEDTYRFHPKRRAAVIAHACELYFLFQLD